MTEHPPRAVTARLAPPRPMRLLLDPRTRALLRLYPGERYEAVLARAMLMLAIADERVDTSGRPKRKHA